MKQFRDIIILLTVTILLLGAGIWLIELHYKRELDKMGLLPKNANANLYDRRISGYTVQENTPNYNLVAYNEKFQPTQQQTDSNGFITGAGTLQKRKDSNTVRIFITGGSAAWGSIESRNIMEDTSYPSGVYCYQASIAGKLKSILQLKYPAIKFEVINAAVVAFRFHQSMALYFERLHDFNPDVIINIDGFNDMANFVSVRGGDPYPNATDQLEDELQLSTMARLPQKPYSLAYYNLKYIRQKNQQLKKTKRNAAKDKTTIINHDMKIETYEMAKPYLHISDKMLWLVQSYERQLRTDDIYSVFCLQPTLRRRIYQKELSPKELKFRTFLEKVTVGDTLNIEDAIKTDSQLTGFYEILRPMLHTDIYWMQDMLSAYSFNDLSPVLDSIVISNGGAYLDVNKSIAGIKSDQEFYVDYCHLTPYGNEFIAGLLADKLADFMKNHRHPKF